jgi:hypothetical protein
VLYRNRTSPKFNVYYGHVIYSTPIAFHQLPHNAATAPSRPKTPITAAAGTCEATAKALDVLVPAPCVEAVRVPLNMIELSLVPVEEPEAAPPLVVELPAALPVLEGVLVVTTTLPPSFVLVMTLGAPSMLPTLTAPLNSLTLTSKLAMLLEYFDGIAVSHAGGLVAVRAELRIKATSVPVTDAAEAAEAMAG